ncbi:methyltransferase domain-containing protein [Gloeocapsopsis sp. IPPAS B-1203]|uniref:class I SAM-dependent methyltransferase n=1 Tax=Gloeocapsopsis sp. IPPAS B-1203 TaxID=2049454 RepID=UPI000C18A562|nr:methyltransferase domain-containing protein [Gloeocapsopsis sp. IPPAS B-1203]PIG92867.1 SAM-dependent methyltransferase [Gloeocapsopsis sp. IPPAS B-1203]
MQVETKELSEKIRQQFDTGPYPRIALEKSPKNDAIALYIHSLVNAYYLRNQKVISTEGKLILDAGCGSGYKSLILAEANPGAKIVGVDISANSIELAKQRLQYHGFDNAQFYVCRIEELPSLGLQFDYINCDDVLYLLSEPAVGLQAMKSVLKPDGIIRANLHSSLQRTHYYRAQEVFKMMGLMDDNPQDLEIDLVRDTMNALKDHVKLKSVTWKPELETDKERILMNYLFQGDKGYTIPELFAALRTAELEFISMINWRQWNLMDLFKEPNNLPAFLAISLPEATVEEQLTLFELLHPMHRLIDFWCGHPQESSEVTSVAEWSLSDWQTARVYLIPQIKQPEVKQEVIKCINQRKPFDINRFLPLFEHAISIDSSVAACLLPLWDSSQSIKALVERWQKIHPLNPVTLEPTAEEEILQLTISALAKLHELGYVYLESNFEVV